MGRELTFQQPRPQIPLWVVVGTTNPESTGVIERRLDVGNKKFAGCPQIRSHVVRLCDTQQVCLFVTDEPGSPGLSSGGRGLGVSATASDLIPSNRAMDPGHSELWPEKRG